MAWKAGHAGDWQNVKRRGWKQIRTALTEEREVGKGLFVQKSCIVPKFCSFVGP